ncbi:hypothetical protein KUTeg_016956 [Tegillarca granosa]|uniref:Uncharacterized protein n=1 Tax=Tegillarca granosa TaxID=220873 RepID=A0ABQ9EME6_TEGGR|nr:hypothetical protein KUTeg_016956 [Tegillarca granosa]
MADQLNVYTRNIQYNGLTSTNYNDIQPVKNFVWEEKAKSIKDLTTLCRPPFTARVHKGDISQFSSSWTPDNKNGDILQVLEIRRRKVVVIRKMQWERRTSEYVTGGKQIDVPATYKAKKKNCRFFITVLNRAMEVFIVT